MNGINTVDHNTSGGGGEGGADLTGRSLGSELH